jgi:glutathione synthase/RimK-type ligase-like ATP-grasp enzyme
MKTVVFLGSRAAGEKNNAAALAQDIAAKLSEDFAVRHYYFEDLLLRITSAQRSVVHAPDGADLASADLVIALNWYPAGTHSLRDLALATALYLEEKQVPFWNREMLAQRATTKLAATWLLAQNGVAVPETYFSLNHEALASAWPHDSAIVKDIAASRGRRNYLAQSHNEVASLLGNSPETRYMLQSCIPNDFDIRLICFGGRPQLAMKRQRQDASTHLNNTSRGGEATLLALETIPEQVLEEAASICQLFGRELAGIDYVVAKDGSARYICLEVNAVPQLTSGSFTTEKSACLAKTIATTIRKDDT